MTIMGRYIIEQVPADRVAPGSAERPWYCHMDGLPNVPVFGSIGTRAEAAAVCRAKNSDGSVHYAAGRRPRKGRHT